MTNKSQGQVLIIVALLLSAVAATLVLGTFSPLVRQMQIVRNLEVSKKSYFAAEAGSEDVYYRLQNNLAVSSPVVLSLEGATVTTTVSTISLTEKEILSQGNADNLIRTVVKDITITDGFAFNFAVQVGLGGLRMQNDSDIIGNVYSNGPIEGDNKDKNFIVGDAVSAGSSGSIDNIHATSSAYAHTIRTSSIDKDAYYQSIDSGTLVGGTKYSGSADQPSVVMPISETFLDQWENNASAGGTITSPCPYSINSSVTIGPVKINCDVSVSGNKDVVVTLAGAIWINGNLVVNNDPKFKVSDSVGNKSVPVVVHSTSDPVGKGIVEINHNPTFYASSSYDGSFNPDSYVVFISRNTGTESGTLAKAITAGNSVTGDLLLYAPHGLVELSNNVFLRGVTSYKLMLKNNTQVYYTSGFSHPLFVSGPGGAWKIEKWKEVR